MQEKEDDKINIKKTLCGNVEGYVFFRGRDALKVDGLAM